MDFCFQNLHVIQKIGAEKVQWAQHFIDRGFQGWWNLHNTFIRSFYASRLLSSHLFCPLALEPILKQTAGEYCVGDEVSMATKTVTEVTRQNLLTQILLF